MRQGPQRAGLRRWLAVAGGVAIVHLAPAAKADAPVRLGPSCPVAFRASIQQMAKTLGPAIEATSRAQLAAASHAWRALRFDTGLSGHAGPATITHTDLAARLPAGIPLPPTLESLELLFLRPGDPDSDRALAAWQANPANTGARALVFVVNVTGAEFEEARRKLPPVFRGVFPASPGWARFLGVTTYPARVAVRNGVAQVRGGDLDDPTGPSGPTSEGGG